VVERIALFDPVHGIGLNIAAGSGRSWMEEPDGDSRQAHCYIDVPRDTLLASPEPEPRPRSGILFVAWDRLLHFADELAELGAADTAGTVALGDSLVVVRIQLRGDGRLRAETEFTQGHHVTITLRCQTRWDWHFGVRDNLPALADQMRTAVRLTRPGHRT
jgi:hypothetical protein